LISVYAVACAGNCVCFFCVAHRFSSRLVCCWGLRGPAWCAVRSSRRDSISQNSRRKTWRKGQETKRWLVPVSFCRSDAQ
jgi:hypothetical protein